MIRVDVSKDRPEPKATPTWKPFPLANNPHPKSGYHYIHVIGSPLSFIDEYAPYRAEAARTPWMSFVARDYWNEIVRHPAWTAERNFWILWSGATYPIPPAEKRKSKIALYYGEAIGSPPDMVSFQVQYNGAFKKTARSFDQIFIDTPTAVKFLKQWHPHVDLAPVGYDPVMGAPDWKTEKPYDIGIYGTFTGRRLRVWPALKKRFGAKLLDVNGLWGAERTAKLNQCRCTVLIAHSSYTSGSTLRLWQAAASSAALLKEKDDFWPSVAGRDFLEIPRFEDCSVDAVIAAIESHLKGNLTTIAKSMYDNASKWTVRRIMEECYVPASMKNQ
jgi:hypothetical protein